MAETVIAAPPAGARSSLRRKRLVSLTATAALPGQSEPHAYFTVVERGSDLAGIGQADTAISATVAADGTVSDVQSSQTPLRD